MDSVEEPAQRTALALLGVPIQAGTSRPGCLMGPAALRTAGLASDLTQLGYTVRDHGNLVPERTFSAAVEANYDPRLRNVAEIVDWTRALSERVRGVLHGGELPIVMGGDHSLSMGSIDGVARHCRDIGRELFVLWLDAHADFNTPETTPSGNMHGMPLAALCGESGLDIIFAEGRAALSPAQVHLFGIRSVDRGERTLLSRRGVNVVDMRLIDEWGVAVPLRRILDAVKARNGVLHVSLDIDFLDPTVAPGVGTTVPGGATYREAHLIMEIIHDSGLLGSLDLVELNPFLDERGRSAMVLVELVSSLFGRQVVEKATRLPSVV